jgi:flagellar biosynthetic protein FliP
MRARLFKLSNAKWMCRVLFLLPLFLYGQCQAESSALLPALTASPGPGGAQTYSLSVQALLFFGALSFLPALLLMTTAFTRIVIVLSLLRHALGLQTSPPNQVIIGLSLFLTMFVMGPTFDKVYADAWQPYTQNKIGFDEAIAKGSVPLKAFMLKQTRQADLALFVKISHDPAPVDADSVSMRLLVPAFVTSELKTAFQIGFAIFIPFLIIDLVTASVLMSMGMMMVSPSIISMPLKLMLFVLVDGWQLLIGSLAASFAT